jgi:cobaltochelatase CobN
MHILATQTASLDETDSAVDLAQTPADVVVASFSDSDLSALAAAWSEESGLPSLRLADLKRLRHPMSVDLYVESVLRHAKVIVLRCLGGLEYWRYGLESIASVAKRRGILLAALPGDDRADPRLAELSTVAPDALARLDGYFRNGGTGNLRQALRYLAALQGHAVAWQEPAPVGSIMGFRADGSLVAADSLAAPVAGRPAALIIFYRALAIAGDAAPITTLMGALEHEGLAPLAVAVSSLKDPAIAADLQQLIASAKPRVILNTTAFSALRDDGTTILDEADAPVLQVVLAGSSRDAWEATTRGLNGADQAMNVVLPELDGRILTRAISFKEHSAPDPALEFSLVRHRPDAERVAFVAKLAAGWVRLGQKPPHDRRAALILSDYPAREGRAGYAVGLDSVESTLRIAELLQGEGFDIGHGIARTSLEAMLNGMGDELRIPLARYREWFAALPFSARETIVRAWGEPEDDTTRHGDAFRFRVIRAGSLIIALQPDRGAHGDRKGGYHDATMPPRHSYVAFYAWLRQEQRIDALIHLGTHGTLEWLPGKALALSRECWPELVLGPMPVIYPFIVNNPGEAVQVKRRLGAITIGHLTPPLRKAGLHGRLSELEALVEEYAAADGIDKRRTSALEQAIMNAAHASGFAAECGLAPSETGREAIAKLDARLCDIKELSIRDSFHVFARAPSAADQHMLAKAMEDAAPVDLSGAQKAAAREALSACARHEGEALIRALAGRRIAPGPAGAPTRGRLDVLPTGRNLTSIDPRAIPTRVSATIGKLAAEEVVRRYLQDHGDYPRALMMTLWASASLRTGGDDLAQALYYLGALPVWDAMSNRVTGIEVLPLAKLGRPRIDVTLRISGLFRDLFETQIALFDLAVRQVAARDEEAADNPLAEVRWRGGDLARIFGGAPGTYGAGVSAVTLDTAWSTRDELGRAALANVTHRYAGGADDARPHDGFRARIAASEALVHPQDNAERDILDGDDVADFTGSLAAAAAMLGGKPALYCLDTSQPMEPRVRDFAEAVARVVRGRLTNPRWLAGMLAHGHRGVGEIAQGVDALYAMAATADVVPAHLFEAVHDAVVADEAILTAMIGSNPGGAAAIARRLQDALARGMWTARRNAVSDELSDALTRCASGKASYRGAAE